MRHNFLLCLLLGAPLLVTGCGDINDPVISNPVITTTAIAPTTLSISWAKASDSNTGASALVYKVYVSGPNPAYQSFDTLGEVETGTLVQTLTDAGSTTISTGITTGSAHYINVVVEDEDGNKTLYEPLGEFFHNNQVSYYPFGGNTNDVTATSNHLVVAVDPALPALALPTVTSDRFLHAGSAYSFNPATPQCLQSTSDMVITGNADRTVSFWVQSSNTPSGTTRAAFAWGNESGNGTSFGFRESGLATNWTVWLGTGSISTGTLATSSWEHWVVSSTGGSVSTYKNGTAVNSAAAATVNTATPSLLYVGCGRVGAGTSLGNLYQGNIDDVRIFNSFLNTTDVANLYRVTQP